jgi:CheY-like chemotaxis protein
MSGAGTEYGKADNKPRIMLVDDEECIRETISELLGSEGIEIVTAVGAHDCLKLLHAGFRGVILMDVMMPVMDGWATIREIEKAGLLQGNIISMLTAMDVPDERMEGLQEVVIDYITKPFDPVVFVATVRRYLDLLDQLHGTC